MRRGEIWWAHAAAGVRPVALVSCAAHLEARGLVLAAPVTTRARGIDSEVALGPEDGLFKPCAINAAALGLIAKSTLVRRLAPLSPTKRDALDAALRYSLGLDREKL